MSNNGQNCALRGAIIGGGVAVGIPVALLAIASIEYKGGGANIGIGLMFLAMPIYVPISIFLGWKIGKRISRK